MKTQCQVVSGNEKGVSKSIGNIEFYVDKYMFGYVAVKRSHVCVRAQNCSENAIYPN